METTSPAPETDQPGRYWLDNESFLARIMLLPAAVYIILLVGVPFVLAVLYSFSDVTIATPEIDGLTLDTFGRVINDPIFRESLVNTIFFTFVSQLIVVLLANILAQALMHPFPGKWLVRLLILLPWATPIAIGAIGWLWMLDSVYSPIDYLLREMHLLTRPGQWIGVLKNSTNMYWLGEAGLARFAMITIYVWRMLPMSTVIITAGLTSIPSDIKDAVAVDGVGWWREYREVTLPLLRPILLIAFLFGVIFSFTEMTVVHVLTRGGPVNATQVLASRAFYQGIESGNLAEGAATAIFMLPVMLAVAAILLRTARRTEVQ
jgi:multiple sugar transport system permease protein